MIQQNEALGNAKTENKLIEIKNFRVELCLDSTEELVNWKEVNKISK